MALDKITYAAAKKYVDKSIAGGGISAGKNCTIDNISPITGGNRVTFKWTLDDGTVQTNYMDVMDGDKGETGDDGLGIKSVDINTQNHLIIIFDDDTTRDAGELPGGSGEVISVNGKKGVVTLDANDVGALPDDTELFSGDYNDLDNLPDLTNFITNTVDNLVNYYKKTETYTKTEVDNIANTIKNGRFEVVATLPTTDIKTNVIYLVPKNPTQTQNIKDEYINLDGTSAGWEKIGDTEIDLSGYVTTTALNTALAAYTTTTDLTALLADKVDKVAGKGLSTNDYTNTDKELVDSIPTLAPISLVKDTVGWTGKNLLKNQGFSRTINGLTYVYNTDGSVTVNGTATANSYIQIKTLVDTNPVPIDGIPVILSGAPAGSAVDKYWLYVKYRNADNTAYEKTYEDYGNGIEFTIPSGRKWEVYMAILNGQTVNNLTFYPMLRKADITDPTYEPYHESVETMYEEEIHGVNLLKNKIVSQTINGITWTLNADGTITANGTAESQHSQIPIPFTFNKSFDAIFSGCPAGGGTYASSKYDIYIWDNVANERAKKWNGTTPVDSDYGNTDQEVKIVAGRSYVMTLRVFTGQTVSNLVFKPMLRKANIENSTYHPYNEQAIQNQLNAQGVLGAKNLLEIIASTTTLNGITFTVNADKSVTVNGTATANTNFRLIPYANIDLSLWTGKSLRLSGCPSGGSNPTYALEIYYNDGEQHWLRDFGDGVELSIPISGLTSLNPNIMIKNGVTVNNLVFKPMVRLASDPDDTYVPYAMTNRELTEKVKDTDLTEVSSLLDSTYVSSCGSFRYKVRNGICFVYINNIKFTSAAIDLVDFVILSEGVLPRGLIPASSILWNKTVPPLLLGLIRNNDGDIKVTVNGVNSDNVNLSWYAASFSYPVI